MKLLLLMLVLGVIALVIAVAAGSITGGLGDPARSTPDPGLPAGPLRAQDLESLRFTPALRGYRMDQVDAVLDRLRDQLAELEAEPEARSDPAAFPRPPDDDARLDPAQDLDRPVEVAVEPSTRPVGD